MTYIDPKTVVSPKGNWNLKNVIFNTGDGGWSVAEGQWNKKNVLCIRWNGSENESGSPQSRGYPTWFVIPNALKEAVLQEINRLQGSSVWVECKIFQPEGFAFGAWKVEATLSAKVMSVLTDGKISFSLPSFANRLLNPDLGFKTFYSNEIQGLFVGGKWKGELYTNGVAEENNPSSIDIVRNTLIKNVEEVLKASDLFEI